MASESQQPPPLFSEVDVAPTQSHPMPSGGDEHLMVMRQILSAVDRQNELLEELVTQTNASQRQRSNELGQWKQANPELAKSCKMAAEALSRVQIEFLSTLTEEANENAEALMDGEFMLTEFVDRFGPRLAHLNGVLQVLTQLSGENPQQQQR